LTGTQLTTGVLVVMVAAVMATLVVFTRGAARPWAFVVLALCAGTAISSWTRNGAFQDVYVDEGTPPSKVKLHRPLHFHDFLHYYLGPKYFDEIGYLGLYACLTLADREIALEDSRPPWITGTVRDLEDILADKPAEESLADCRARWRPRFTETRWASFKADVRELGRLTTADQWGRVVLDAGFNPPPSLVVFGHALTNLVPIRTGRWPTYLAVTGVDLALLIACFLVVRAGLGNIVSLTFVVFFGASFLSDYSWNGGSVLRFTWFVSLVCGIVALKQRRWATAGALLGFAACDRIFPLAFGAAAMVPVAWRARHAAKERKILRRFVVAFGVTVLVLVLASVLLFGVGSWTVFFQRIARHDEVYHPLHIGLRKVLTFRHLVPFQNFREHDGNARYREWNLALRATWAAMRPVTLPLQALVVGATTWAASRRRPHEAALLGGVVFMFTFTLPANYYYCILALVPAAALFSAATTSDAGRRWRDFVVCVGFAVVWAFTFLAPLLPGDDLTFTFRISTALFLFLLVWIGLWSDLPRTRVPR